MIRHRPLAILLALGLPVVACGDGDVAGGRTALTVFAASSLTEAFTQVGEIHEREHPGVRVRFNFAGSSSLRRQLAQGASADVVATAHRDDMDQIVRAGDAADPVVVAANRLALIVEPGNPRSIRSLGDLARSDVTFVRCAPEVPCGRLTDLALARARVQADPASLEENVKAVVSRVTLGEADAGIVYATDVLAAGDEAEGVAIGGADDPSLLATYPVAVATRTADREAAEAFVDVLRSPAGQDVFTRLGFLPPP